MMTGMITLVLTGLLRGVRTQRSLVFENLALRHQLAVLQRAAPRPRLRRSDRLFCDRDGVYGVEFSSRVKGMGICEVKTAPRSPWQNPYVERLIGTLRRECLDHVVVLNETNLRRLLRLLSPRPNTPLPRQGRAGAKIGRAPRARPDRRDAHGQRRPSSRYPPGGVGSFGPAGGLQARAAGQRGSLRSSCALRV